MSHALSTNSPPGSSGVGEALCGRERMSCLRVFRRSVALRASRQIAGRLCAALRVSVVLLERECLPTMKQGAVRVHFSEQGFLFTQFAVCAAQQGSAEQTMRPGQRTVRREFVDMQGLIVRPQ